MSPAPTTIEIDRLPVAVLLVDVDGTIAELNSAACRLLGQPREALLGADAPRALGLGSLRWQAL
ncbi:MAG TPA: PAS domain-containing protein, partial [Kofleriaceae bacterium]|nr:PAS domain-containing protein [Kofleriaceae bacterium]